MADTGLGLAGGGPASCRAVSQPGTWLAVHDITETRHSATTEWFGRRTIVIARDSWDTSHAIVFPAGPMIRGGSFSVDPETRIPLATQGSV